jgi:murein DD-endopeptidase MepM/ murein hydrolase activator NlpD
MTVRRGNAKLKILTLAAAIVLPLLVAGCTTSPEPYFGWDTQASRPHRQAAARPRPRPTPTYTESQYAEDRYGNRYNRDCNCYAQQQARQTPKWYDRPADPRDDTEARPQRPYDYNGNVRFQWPVRGRVLSEFGSYPGGEKNNGINIAAADREPIRAAADGTVSYAGNELRGYGNLVLIKHDGGYITAYAHADHFVVGKGQWVAKGQVIGYVGSTGDVRVPQLHFEVRRGNHGETPVDPRQVLGSMQVAYR